MTFQLQPPGPSNVLEYQASGLPFATAETTVSASVTNVSFPFVTKFFCVKNTSGSDITVGFTENGTLGTNNFTVAAGESHQFDIRVIDLYFTAGAALDFEVVAGLTQIPRRNFYVLTGALNGFSGSQIPHQLKGFGYDGIG